MAHKGVVLQELITEPAMRGAIEVVTPVVVTLVAVLEEVVAGAEEEGLL